MSNAPALKKRMFVLLTQLRMEGRITKGDWELFKQVVEKGIKAVYSIDETKKRGKQNE